MEKIDTDYKRRTGKNKAKFFKMPKLLPLAYPIIYDEVILPSNKTVNSLPFSSSGV